MFEWTLLFLCGALWTARAQRSTRAQPVTLPNWNGVHGAQPNIKCGYINVDQQYGRNLFYWLIEATDVNPATAPLVVWFQGGPGGAGEFGLFAEMGPLALSGSTLDPSRIQVSLRKTGAWTKWVNMIFIDQPAGVSFSFSRNATDYALNNDSRSAHDNLKFLETFIKLEPQYAGRDLYITGESYGGIYCPMLSLALASSRQFSSSFRGMFVGNPVFYSLQADEQLGTPFQIVNMLYFNGYVSFADMEQFWSANCTDAMARRGYESATCRQMMRQLLERANVGQDFVSVNRFMDPCRYNGTLAFAASRRPCVHNYEQLIDAYLRQPRVVSAIHARAPQPRPNWAYATGGNRMERVYEQLIRLNKRILVFSGDLDISNVPFVNTQANLARISNRGALKTKWQPWVVNNHTAGHFEQYDGYTYATVRGAGHEAPLYQPMLTDALFHRFLINNTLTQR